MFGETDLLGAFVPGAAIWFVIALLIFAALDWYLAKKQVYKYFWHAPLVRFALFVCLFSVGGWFVSF
jgi:Protein of unknown function (DUF1656)